MKHKLFIGLLFVVALVVIVVVIQIVVIKTSGRPVPVPNIPRDGEHYGEDGTSLTYVVLGDSTAVGQGGNYDKGIARSSARHLGENHRVTMFNLAISGARAADIEAKQLSAATRLEPDVVLVAVCANDVTHNTDTAAFHESLLTIAQSFLAIKPDVRIIVTGSPAMGTVPRLPQPTRWLAGTRTTQLNRIVQSVVDSKKLTLAPIAAQTGPSFAEDHSLFAADKFHPNDRGYALWVPIINRALDQSLQK